jgi:uncharacterized protein (TIGR02265 family)
MSSVATARPTDDWGDHPISREQADDYASRVPGISAAERAGIAKDMQSFPVECRVRGVFFEGLSRVVARDKLTTMGDLFARAGVSPRKIAFTLYPHRDFYRIYFLAARALYPRAPLGDALSQVSRTFYPIFRESMIGRTMSAFISNDPAILLSRLAEAYKLSIPWNEHAVLPTGPREVSWRCKVEGSSYYRDVFTGIVSGATASHGTPELKVDVQSSKIESGIGNHVFRIRW